MNYQLIESLRKGELRLPEYLAQVEAHFGEHEPSILAFVPEENRFARLQREADALVLRYPDLIIRPPLFAASRSRLAWVAITTPASTTPVNSRSPR